MHKICSFKSWGGKSFPTGWEVKTFRHMKIKFIYKKGKVIQGIYTIIQYTPITTFLKIDRQYDLFIILTVMLLLFITYTIWFLIK